MGRVEGGLVELGVVYSAVLHGEPQSWFVSLVAAGLVLILVYQVWEPGSVSGARAGAVFRSRIHLWLGSEPELRPLG